ncbi:hypothetical protein, partial [Pseudomonas syringae group genomosp. 7]|uniref:hypothetical protein n=1 Tax=Pseudomonas syringae group genomosp. 7 TaxID=251699 RepID=UPI00376FFAC0
LVRPTDDGNEVLTWEPDVKIRTSIASAMDWLADIGLGEPGVTVIPRDLLDSSPPDFVRNISRMNNITS